MNHGRFRIGIDVGGTFTDICAFDETTGRLQVAKTPSTPQDSSLGIFHGLKEILERLGATGGEVGFLAHGTTVSTNTLIQHTGAKTGLITTRGFKDLLEIGRQMRPDLYDLQVDKPPALVPRDLRLEVKERIYGDGRVLEPLDREEVRTQAGRLAQAGVQAVAVCLLHAYLVPDHEQEIKRILKELLPGVFLSISHEVVPEFREYERLSTTVVNAYLGPGIDHYISRLEQRVKELGIERQVYITQSNGGLISTGQTRRNPVRTALSGPSTGVIGGVQAAGLAGFEDVITFDMGGTSTDVCLVQKGHPHQTNLRVIEGYPVKTPMIDVHTVGAGGGSIAWIDSGGHLKVGPRSAGSDPGPVCYARGGSQVTVTDANVVLGTLNPRHLLGGRMPIQAQAAQAAVDGLARRLGLEPLAVARGVVSIVTANMVKAIRVISVQRGYDPRRFTLVAFGGAGPLHAGWVAKELNIRRLVIPKYPGIECAFGILVADMRSDFTLTRVLEAGPGHLGEVEGIYGELEAQARQWMDRENLPPGQRAVRRSIDMRYRGQNFELTLPLETASFGQGEIQALVELFHEAHQQHYGYSNPKQPVQMVAFRVEALGLRPKISEAPVQPEADPGEPLPREERTMYLGPEWGGSVKAKVFWRDDLGPGQRIVGPAVVEQLDATTLLLPGQRAAVDGYFNLIVSSGEEQER